MALGARRWQVALVIGRGIATHLVFGLATGVAYTRTWALRRERSAARGCPLAERWLVELATANREQPTACGSKPYATLTE